MHNFFVVSTPIGNSKDITERAIEVLKSVDVILCENTKHSLPFLLKKNIKNKKLISLHKFDEKRKLNLILDELEKNDIALISDSGTPLVSDPGQKTIHELKKRNIKIFSIPGANSILAAITSSGLEFNTFSFCGFIDKQPEKISRKIVLYSNTDISVFFESPKRINKTLEVIYEKFGDINIVVARELTKIHEEIINSNIKTLLKKTFRGEIVLIINNKTLNVGEQKLNSIIPFLKEKNISNKDVIEIVSKLTKFKKNEVYTYIKEKRNEKNEK